MIGKKKRKVTDEGPRVPRAQRLRFPVLPLLRVFLIGSVAVVGAGWAIWRHYTIPHAPMLVPVTPAPAPTEIDIEP